MAAMDHPGQPTISDRIPAKFPHIYAIDGHPDLDPRAYEDRAQ